MNSAYELGKRAGHDLFSGRQKSAVNIGGMLSTAGKYLGKGLLGAGKRLASPAGVASTYLPYRAYQAFQNNDPSAISSSQKFDQLGDSIQANSDVITQQAAPIRAAIDAHLMKGDWQNALQLMQHQSAGEVQNIGPGWHMPWNDAGPDRWTTPGPRWTSLFSPSAWGSVARGAGHMALPNLIAPNQPSYAEAVANLGKADSIVRTGYGNASQAAAMAPALLQRRIQELKQQAATNSGPNRIQAGSNIQQLEALSRNLPKPEVNRYAELGRRFGLGGFSPASLADPGGAVEQSDWTRPSGTAALSLLDRPMTPISRP